MSRLNYEQMRSRAERAADARVKERVLQGLAVLQEKYGDAWVEKIDCESLDLRDEAQCVLGQVCGNYFEGVKDLRDSGSYSQAWAVDHGFNIFEDHDRHDAEAEWDALDDAWHAVLCDKP